ncbi:MAG: aminotransferase class I/II-fold pyridoxal phosphate-dependent enzyme [Tumebacillaceae bacterium]
MKLANKMQYFSSSIFTEIADYKNQLIAEGRDIIDLSIGSPDLPPPPHVREAMLEAVANPGIYGYGDFYGSTLLRTAFADWFRNRFGGVQLNPQTEVTVLIGSQDGLAHLPITLLDPGDLMLLPDPSYPAYYHGARLASAEIHWMPLLQENDYLPDFSAIPEEVAREAKLMVLAQPGNPIPAIADERFFEEAIEFCRKHEIVLVHDLAYSELCFGDYRPISILQIPGAKDVAVEFHSMSKSYSMAGARIGYCVGNPEIVGALRSLKGNIDYGVFRAVQHAATAALQGDQSYTREMSRVYEERRDVLLDELALLGWVIPKPKATMFAWARLPVEMSSREFAFRLMDEAGVATVPGEAFGVHGEGHVRIALVQPTDRLREAARRIAESGILNR